MADSKPPRRQRPKPRPQNVIRLGSYLPLSPPPGRPSAADVPKKVLARGKSSPQQAHAAQPHLEANAWPQLPRCTRERESKEDAPGKLAPGPQSEIQRTNQNHNVPPVVSNKDEKSCRRHEKEYHGGPDGGKANTCARRKWQRRRRLTTLKKRILLERAARWEELMGAEDVVHNHNPRSASPSDYLSVRVTGLINGEELNDEDEYEETMSNVREMAEDYGEVGVVTIPRDGPGVGEALILFHDEISARRAVEGLNGRVIGGVPISAAPDYFSVRLMGLINGEELEDEDEYEETMSNVREMADHYGEVDVVTIPRSGPGVGEVLIYFHDMGSASKAVEDLNGRIVGGVPISAAPTAASTCKSNLAEVKIRVDNLICIEDMEDEESYEEVCKDVRKLAERFGQPSSLQLPIYSSDSRHYEVIIGYSCDQEANAALSSLQGMVVGGRKLSASSFLTLEESAEQGFRVAVSGWVTEDDNFVDENEYFEVMESITTKAEEFGRVMSLNVPRTGAERKALVIITYSNEKEAQKAADSLSNVVIRGSKLEARVDAAMIRSAGLATEEERKALQAAAESYARAIPLDVRRKTVPDKYSEAATVPKIPAGVIIPSVQRVPAVGYTLPAPIPEVDVLVVEMLKKLFDYQERARLTAGANARRSRRLVMGLREVRP
jgi:hypothetical protein